MKTTEEVKRDLHTMCVIRDAAKADLRGASADMQGYWLGVFSDAEREVAELEALLASMQ